ncbi:sensor histidine kinase [Pelotalea chapellei]|uniref:histidine kinase n=1 Tax=Pelotalea chapellei TaxID=44671 RepID=A0ABS5U5Y3_9BACT|nr:HAMP domain-containing sensor histidine kinase [Pelotalea chapellei]MBT1071059.1 HAMP domain-containing histidine kinase [Pelotalea chapellei]
MNEKKVSDIPRCNQAIDELKRENEILAQQVKRLVKAESKLYEFQEELDAQLKEYKDLYQLNRKLNARLDMRQICRLTIDYVIQNLNYERALFFVQGPTGTYQVCSLDGYYEEAEDSEVAGLSIEQDDPFLAPLFAGSEYLLCKAGTETQGLECLTTLHMHEYFVYPLGAHRPRPVALLAVGNTAANSEFYRKVDDSNGTLLSMGNFVGLVSSSIENYFSYHQLEESEARYRHLNEILEQRVRDAVKELREKDRILIVQGRQAVMGEMISNIAHQWRQPLNILGLLAQELQMIKQLGDLNSEHIDENVNKTMKVIQQMSKTIDDFRNFFKPDKEKVEFKVLEALDKTLSVIEERFKKDLIQTDVERTGDPVVIGYPGEFTQVLLNILINSRDALIARNVDSPKICIKVFEERSKTVVTIIDNAGGIPEEIIDKVFEPYFTTKGPEQGTGIGLFMCKTIIEKNMNGTLSVCNVKDGALFRIEV